ncbi:hypothetical protein CVU37_00450 [candidate division BRC1 bacterium HGW-BRC1-1]|jgi:hypothetical protein|nr:MAG: hypothetical protein CVU37_00450 [candidate division BRC1 bacterium HGW-BRC1-1]
MRVTTASPIKGLDGSYKSSDLVFYYRNGQTFARARVTPRNPDTIDQQKIRAYITAATRNWDELTAAQRSAWQDYAEAYFTVNSAGRAVTPQGLPIYVKANITRQILGLALTTSAPTQPPPTPISDLASEPADELDRFDIIPTHSITTITGLALLVRITPAMLTVARTPRENELRYIKGVSPASAPALTASGSVISITNAQYAIDAGKRYAIQARVVRTADGIASEPLFRDLTRSLI